MVLVALFACTAGSPYGDDLLPTEEQIRINLPEDSAAKTATDPTQDWATFYVMTRRVTRDVNGMIGFVLGLVGTVVKLPPSWVDEEKTTAMWGPWSDSGLDPVETGMTLTRAEDGTLTWAIFQIPKGGDLTTDRLDIATGEVDAGSRRRDASGRFTVDFDTAHALDPGVNLVGSFSVDYDYDRAGVAAVAAFADYGLPAAPVINAEYAYTEDYEGTGSMDLAWYEDFTFDGVADLGAMRSRWQSDGQGRSDARITIGDGAGELTASECWDSSFARVYWVDSAGLSPNEGDPAACVYTTAEYATEASFDPVQ